MSDAENIETNGSGGIESLLKEQGFYVSTTVGWSMWPMLRNRRDRVILLPVGSERLKKYDLPLYKRPDGKYILHRIIGVRDGEYIIRGDNTYVKEHIPDEWILGYVSEFYRADKHVLTSSRGYRFYAALWNLIFPVRWVIWCGRRFAGKCLRAIKKAGHREPNKTSK